VKSAVKGMDAVQQFADKEWNIEIKTFTVSGASKRGWTTWLTGATDERVTAIAPMVIDMLNMEPQLRHQKEAWGELSYKIDDYTRLDLPRKLNTDRGRELQRIVDPFQYRESLAKPKLIIIGTNDHYWPLDALNLYWDQLIGPKYILYVPNNRHGLKDYGRVITSVYALHQHAARQVPLPRLEWEFSEADGAATLCVKSDIKPRNVRVWVAASPKRDFREATWEATGTTSTDDVYRHKLEVPRRGFVAMFGEAEYAMDDVNYQLSTNVRIYGADVASEKGDKTGE
jgi:PhoPQ-activated pathogenicity-related protein